MLIATNPRSALQNKINGDLAAAQKDLAVAQKAFASAVDAVNSKLGAAQAKVQQAQGDFDSAMSGPLRDLQSAQNTGAVITRQPGCAGGSGVRVARVQCRGTAAGRRVAAIAAGSGSRSPPSLHHVFSCSQQPAVHHQLLDDHQDLPRVVVALDMLPQAS